MLAQCYHYQNIFRLKNHFQGFIPVFDHDRLLSKWSTFPAVNGGVGVGGWGWLVDLCHIIHVYLSYKYDFNRYSPHLLATNYSNYISIIDNTALYIVHFMTSMQVARIINPKWTDTHNHQGNPNVNNYYFLRVSSIIYITWSRFSCQRNFKKAFLLPSVYFYDVNINVSVLKIFLLFILFPLNLPSCRINGENELKCYQFKRCTRV